MRMLVKIMGTNHTWIPLSRTVSKFKTHVTNGDQNLLVTSRTELDDVHKSSSKGDSERTYRLVIERFPRELAVTYCEIRLVKGRVSTISSGSIPARGFPTGFLTLSIPL